MIVRMDGAFGTQLRGAQKLVGAIGYDFIAVHVCLSA